ncbi:MAG: phytoene dehydrogenase-like protein, partial [Bacteroidia bacterium]
MNVAVIGSGVAGLAASIRLAHRGHSVTVFEANSYPGGKLTTVEKDGFKWDAGPSLFTMPDLVDEVLNLAEPLTENTFVYR